jgi:hypothetical protein
MRAHAHCHERGRCAYQHQCVRELIPPGGPFLPGASRSGASRSGASRRRASQPGASLAGAIQPGASLGWLGGPTATGLRSRRLRRRVSHRLAGAIRSRSGPPTYRRIMLYLPSRSGDGQLHPWQAN